MVLTVDGTKAEYYVFKGFTTGIAAGQHRVWARAIDTAPTEQLDSKPQLITVEAAPTYAKTVDLTADMVVPSQGYSLVGSASGRVRLNGHGYSIKTSGSISGQVTLQFVGTCSIRERDQYLEGRGGGHHHGWLHHRGLQLRHQQHSQRADLLDGAATASIRRNIFRSNMRMPLGQQPYPPDSSPALSFTGSSSGAKVFAGNNLAAGWFAIDSAKGWVLGGDTDADSNVLIGARVGLTVSSSSNVQVRRNFSHHVYFGGWSQGANFELFGSPAATVEHNVVYGSSWPVRGVGCEFRYNLVLDAGHEWLWPEPNGSIHHNIFYGGENDVGGIFVRESYSGIKFFNNTLDGGHGWMYAVEQQAGAMTLTSNAFVNVPKGTTVHATGATLTADYNFFDNTQANYWDSRHPAHDVGGQAMLTMPPTTSFDLDESAVWRRGTTVSSVLALYRTRYTPKAGSPLIDAGDPAGGAGNDIGAVGAGTPNAADKFGQP